MTKWGLSFVIQYVNINQCNPPTEGLKKAVVFNWGWLCHTEGHLAVSGDISGVSYREYQ